MLVFSSVWPNSRASADRIAAEEGPGVKPVALNGVHALSHRRGVLGAFAALGGTVLFTSLTPWVLKEAIDVGIGSGDRRVLILSAIAIVGFSLGKGFFSYLMAYFGEALSQHVAFDLRRDFYDRVQSLSFAFHDQNETGQLDVPRHRGRGIQPDVPGTEPPAILLHRSSWSSPWPDHARRSTGAWAC